MSIRSMASITGFLLLASPCAAREFSGLCARGPSGLFLSPTAALLRGDRLAVGITEGVGKAAYGLLGVAEAGLVTPDLLSSPRRDDWHRELTGFVKAGAPVPGLWGEPALAAGASALVFSATPEGYACATVSPVILGWAAELDAGWGTGGYLNRPFGGIGLVPPGIFSRAVKFLAEYAGEQAAAGARIALSRDLRLDAFVLIRAVPPGGSAGRGSWLIVAQRGIPGASWTLDAGLARLFTRQRARGASGGGGT